MRTRLSKRYADLIVIVHFLWTLFLLGGAIAMFIYPSYAITQIVVMTCTLLLAIPFHNTCPLTLLEEKLRRNYDPTYHNDGSYLATHLNTLFRKNIPVRRVNETITGLYVIVYALATVILILRGYGFLANGF